MLSKGSSTPVFRYIPMSRRKNGQSLFKTGTGKANTHLYKDNVKLTNTVLPLTQPNAYKLMSKARNNFASSSNLGKNNANTVNNKERDLTQTQKKLNKHGYGVDNNKSGLGFTPNTPVKISRKTKNDNDQHINVNIKQNQEEPKPAPRTSVFERLNTYWWTRPNFYFQKA